MTPEPSLAPAPAVPPRKSSRWLIGLLLVLALSGWAVALFQLSSKWVERRKPGAVVVFHVAAQRPTLLARDSATDSVDFESYRATQSAMIRRHLLLNTVLKQPEVANLAVVKAQADPVAWLTDGLRVSFDSPEFMRIELDGEPVDELVIVLNALSKAYLADVEERENGARRARLAKLEETNRRYRDEIEGFHKRMDTIARALGSRDTTFLELSDALARDGLKEAMRELRKVREELTLAQSQLAKGDPNKQLTALVRREQLAKARVEDMTRQISRSSEYRLQLENLRSWIAQSEALSEKLAEQIERLKIELGAPPRITLAEEAHPRRAR